MRLLRCKSKSLQVQDQEAFDLFLAGHKEYLRYKEPEINKTMVTKDIKGGMVIPGVELVERKNMQLK